MNLLEVKDLRKTFTLHLRGGLQLAVLRNISFSVAAGECVALVGPSGAGKSTLLRTIYGNYRAESGSVTVMHDGELVDLTQVPPQQLLVIRRHNIAYVSQFLRVIPRVSTRAIVANVLKDQGVCSADADARAETILLTLNLPLRLHGLPPATFSGGEQQRVNLARALVTDHPVLLLDEPTASLDAENAAVVLSLIQEAKRAGRAILSIFHDPDMTVRVADRQIPIASLTENDR